MLRVACAVLALLSVSASYAQSLSVPATVSGQANIFGAGLATPLPSGSACGAASQGLAPVQIAIPNGATTFTVANVSGSTTCVGATTAPTADGPCAGIAPTSLQPENNLSGLSASGTSMFVTGVFLGNGAPAAPAPAALSFATTNFASLSPLLQQTFFIGDGLTGTGSGSTQVFNIPSGATRLFLGFADGFNFQGASGCYTDNGGSISLNVVFGNFVFPTIPAQDELGRAVVIGMLALLGLAALRSRR